MSSCWTSPERKMCSTVLYDWAKSNTTYGILCREKKCETLRDEGKLIKGIANGIEGEQGKTCFFTELTQFRGTAYTLLAPKPKVSTTLSNRGQNQGKFFMSIYFGLLSEMENLFYKGNKAKCWGWTITATYAQVPSLPNKVSTKWLKFFLRLHSCSTLGGILLV